MSWLSVRNKKKPIAGHTQPAMGFYFCYVESLLHGKILHGLDALGADILPVERYDVLCAVAEDTGGLILLHHNAGAIDIDLQTVALSDVQSTAKLNREDDPSQLVDFTHDTGRFHFFHPFPVKTVGKNESHL